MIQTDQEFHRTRQLLAEANERLSKVILNLKPTLTPSEILNLTDPQVSFLAGMREEAVHYQQSQGGVLGTVLLPPAAHELRQQVLNEGAS